MADKKEKKAPEVAEAPEKVNEPEKVKTYEEMTVSERLAYDNELVEFYVEADRVNREKFLRVCVNGTWFKLARGGTNKAPRYVQKEVERSVRAEDAFYRAQEAKSAEAKAQLEALKKAGEVNI